MVVYNDASPHATYLRRLDKARRISAPITGRRSGSSSCSRRSGTALLAGGLLAFARSFDEVVVTIFTSGAQQTLPIWIFANFARPRELPVVNVVALW